MDFINSTTVSAPRRGSHFSIVPAEHLLQHFSHRHSHKYPQLRQNTCKTAFMTKRSDLPSPGDIVQHDFRSQSQRLESEKPVKVIQWNIERGYKLQAIIEELARLDADIIGLQEIDIHCERSGNVDVGVEIAKALGMNYAFICEFLEIHSAVRSERDQGGGVHGNAILSRHDFVSVEAVRHRHHPIDWESSQHRKTKTEPRKGERLTLCAVVDAPSSPIVVYSCHLEVFCGISDRLYQFSDILRDSRIKNKAGYDRQLILGDLNTVGDGFVRLLPLFCTDHLRFKTIGIREATFWKQNLFQVTDSSDEHLLRENGQMFNQKLLSWGLDPEYCKHLINPGFHDPWSPEYDVTLQRPKTGWANWKFVSGKLDWLLVRHMTIIQKFIGNDAYRYSDHKWLMVTLTNHQQQQQLHV